MRYILARWYLTSGHKKRTAWLKSLKFQWIPWMDGNRSFASKRLINFVTSVLYFEKNAKIVTNLSGGVQYLSFLQGIYGLWQKEKFHTQKKNEGVPIRRSRPVPLKVVWMGFEPSYEFPGGTQASMSPWRTE